MNKNVSLLLFEKHKYLQYFVHILNSLCRLASATN